MLDVFTAAPVGACQSGCPRLLADFSTAFSGCPNQFGGDSPASRQLTSRTGAGICRDERQADDPAIYAGWLDSQCPAALLPQFSGRLVAGNARIEAPEKGDLEGAVQMEAKREFHLLNWLLSAFNLLAGVVRLLGTPARVSCLTKTSRQVTEPRGVLPLVCAGRQSDFPFFFRVMGVVEGSGAIQLAVETETAS